MFQYIKKTLKKFWRVLVGVFSNQSPEEKLIRKEGQDAVYERVFIKTPEPNAITCFNYRDPVVRTAIWMIKYRYNPWLVKILAGVMDEILLEELGELSIFQNFQKPILIPIPMHWKKRLERKFNQAESLARELKNVSSVDFQCEPRILKKVFETESQTKVVREDRRKNVRNSFKVHRRMKKKIKDRNIVLIDDVYTTGSTFREAELVLKEAGAKSVYKVALAS